MISSTLVDMLLVQGSSRLELAIGESNIFGSSIFLINQDDPCRIIEIFDGFVSSIREFQ